MSDLDIWVPSEEMEEAVSAAESLGYERQCGKGGWRYDLKQEVQLVHGRFKEFLVEFHSTPFKGWWLDVAAEINDVEVWTRTEPLPALEAARQLSVEDMIIHLAVHLAVNHQFGLAPLRTLLDLALTSRHRCPRWDTVVSRGKRWKVACPLWMVLDLGRELLGLQDIDQVLDQLKPGSIRRSALSRFVNAKKLIAGYDLRQTKGRAVFLLLLVDGFPATLRLILHTAWRASRRRGL